MNKNQKLVLILGLGIIFLAIIIWMFSGFEIFTKTQVLVETKDELFGWSEKKWLDKFVWGLDLSLLITILTIIVMVVTIYITSDKRKFPNRKLKGKLK